MTEKTNINWQSMSDRAIIESLGLFVKHHRLEQNRTHYAEEVKVDAKMRDAIKQTLLVQ